MMKKSEMGKDKINKDGKFKRPESMTSKNKMRMGGKGLSLEAFANAKSKTDYNPALIKKKREFYKNAKYVSKYKKLKKHENFPNDPPFPDIEPPNDEIETVGDLEVNQKRMKKTRSLNEVYEKKIKEQEKARNEREAIIQAKKERKEQSQSQRKAHREKMLKRTRSGQPVMKYRIEHMLEKVQGSKF